MNKDHLDILVDLLDGTLWFDWTDDKHFVVFSLCRYFLLDETYILPMFKSALQIKYALFNEDYNFFKFIFDMQEANFAALATFHAGWLALHYPFSG